MAEKRDYYEVLEVTKEATVEEIKKAYRKKTIHNHTKSSENKARGASNKDIRQ